MSTAGTVQAQSVSREGCTTGDLTACVRVKFDVANDASTSTSLLRLDVSHLGVFTPLAQVSQPSIVWSFVFTTGLGPLDAVDYAVSPTAIGDATVNDPSMWTFSDVGDYWALTYPSWMDPNFTTKGIGSGIALPGTASDGTNPWSQIGTTGASGAISFSVALPYLVQNVDLFDLFGLEATTFIATEDGFMTGLNGSCGELAACGAVPVRDVPEPSSLTLLPLGAALIGAYANRRRRRTTAAP